MPDRLLDPRRRLGAVAALAVAAGTAFVLARPLWVRAGPRAGDRKEPRAVGLGRSTSSPSSGSSSILAFGWWLATASSRGSRIAASGAPRRWAIVALAAAALGFLALRRPDAFLAAGAALFLAAFFARPELPRRPPRVRPDRVGVLPRALRPALLHLRPDEHVLQALPRGLAPLRRRDGRARLRRRAPRSDRPLGLPGTRGRGDPRGRRPLHQRDRRARRGQPPLRSLSRPVARRPALPGEAAARRVPGGAVAAPERARHPHRPRGAGPLVPGLRPHLDAHRAADGPRLGVPRPAARKPAVGDRDAQERRAEHLRVARLRPLRGAAPALPRRLRLRRSAGAQDLSGRRPPQVRDESRPLRDSSTRTRT